jgi:hypothetical protein
MRVGQLKIKYGHNTYPSITRLGKDISCACRCINHNIWSSSRASKSRGIRPSYSLWKQKIVRIKAELQHHGKRRLSHGICTLEVHALFARNFFQDVHRSFCPTIFSQQDSVWGRICRFLLLFQEFDFEVIVKLGKMNSKPDHLSRVTNGEEPTNLEDNFPDA